MTNNLRLNRTWRWLMLVASMLALLMIMSPGTAAFAQEPDPHCAQLTDPSLTLTAEEIAALTEYCSSPPPPPAPAETQSTTVTVSSASIFFEDFSDNSAGWTLGPEWQIGSATVSTGQHYGYSDPGVDVTPTADNGIAGVVIGGNANTNWHGYYYLTSPVINTATVPGQVLLNYQRWLNSDYLPFMQNSVEVFNGSSWVTLFLTGNFPGVRDNSWHPIQHDVTAYKNANFQVRFGFRIGSYGVFRVSSWNLDDVSIDVPNQPPTADAGGPYSGDEGSPISIAGTASDADGDALTYAWSYTAGAGVDAGATCAFGDASTLSTDITCTDDGTYNLTLTVNDGTASASDATTVDVANVAPDLGAISVDQTVVPVGSTINASASFSDNGSNDTHEASWDWGDGNSTVPASVASPAVASHTYNEPGVYTIELTVADDDTGSDTSIFEYVVVYDPDGGFVTGGGWIDSPAGAYTPDDPNDEDLTGKANFGFVSKYKKGAKTPTGKTEFQFKAADLNFHSDTVKWLVVARAHAKFKGDGTINGADGYGFMLTATDGQANGGGGADKFRIKIWDDMGTEDESDDVVVYDNKTGEDDDSNEGSVLGGGSIVVHTKKK